MVDVLVLSKSFDAPGGVVNFIRSVMAAMPPGVRVEHLAIGRKPGHEGNPVTWLAPLIDNLRLIRTVLKLRPRVVHLNPSFNWESLLRDGMFLLTLKALRRKGTLAFFHGWSPATAERVADSRLLSWLFRFVFSDVPVIGVLASSFKRSLERIGIEPERIHVLTTMYDREIFTGADRAALDGPPTILFLGRLVNEKGPGDVLEAFATLTGKGTQARLVIAGDGPELDALGRRAAELGVEHRVAFPGYLKGVDKGHALLNADLFVFPTRYGEGCPVSLLEAMAAGLPVITTRAGGIPDIFTDEVNGVLLNDASVADLAAAMRRGLTDGAWARACGERNRIRAENEYSAERVVGRLVSLYETASEAA